MYYYNVAPASKSYFSLSLLTYASKEKLSKGDIVEIKLGKTTHYGVALDIVAPPGFETKYINRKISSIPARTCDFMLSFIDYYAPHIGPATGLFISGKMPKKTIQETTLKKDITPLKEIILNKEQTLARDAIMNTEQATSLLHGITGSGKTRIYLSITSNYFQQGQSILILVPEIALIQKTVKIFTGYFGEEHIIEYHSNVSQSRKNKLWLNIAESTKPKIIIGTRSSLFLPLDNIGAIILDEFHDSSYLQDTQPVYSGVKAAALLARAHDAKLILGSATPNITDYYQLKESGSEIVNLSTKAIVSRTKTVVNIVDMNDSNNLISRSNLLSKYLVKQIKNCLENKKQSLLFINRRGTARTILCQDCGWQSLCKNCNIPHVYHHDLNTYLCHECGLKSSRLTRCPACKSEQIFYNTGGTKLIEKQIRELFPTANIARFDKDNLVSENISTLYPEIESGDIDIIIGTQILIKGHDFPKLSLVAMLQADSYLQQPDYTSVETLYQAVNQLYGRIDRGHSNGEFIVQTHNPQNTTIKQGLTADWEGFYKSELNNRKKYLYPPFVYASTIEYSLTNEEKVITNLIKLKKDLILKHNVLIEGPTPSIYSKRNNRHYYRLIIKSRKRADLINIAKELPKNYHFTLEPSHLIR